jgi:hypothetical protein
MPPTCQQCRRVNPREAAFCYHDGTPLDGRSDSSAVDVGSRPFSAPFVLPSGRACRTFNQLALACREDPAVALAVLKKGHLESFLGAQGRADLAEAAHVAARALARAADGERALDDFLGRLPASALIPARLHVEPALIDLGTLRPGQERRCELVLHNKGMRLLYGSASCDGTPWLSLGDGPERQRLLFQCRGKMVIPLRVVGRRLRAFRDPQQGEVRLETNGGTVTVVVRVQVPVQPFPEGVLAGALSPRELASKARAAPKEVAVLIERGVVARWYETNGWTYPVTGPTATGQAAVQQLFEALGLVRPPRVELGEKAIRLRGNPGQKIEHVLPVVSPENRAVVAHGSSDQPWLHVGPTVYRDRSAFLPLTVATVPPRPGETLQANVTVTANGGQRFVVPVTLVVGGPVAAVARPIAVPIARPSAVPPAVPFAPPPRPSPVRAVLSKYWHEGRAWWKALLPAGLLALLLLVIILRDVFAPAGSAGRGPRPEDDPVPRVEIRFHDAKRDDALEARWLPDPLPTMRFGLVTLYKGKEVGKGAAVNRLTFDPWGRTNNTCLRFDGRDERLFGSARGRWEQRDGGKAVWVCDDPKVAVTQSVELVRGEPSRLLDTCQVRYAIENRDSREHTIGIRFLLDTFIGGNDGVPFTIPGDSDLCDTLKDLRPTEGKPIPDFLQALEKPDLAHPGTIAHLRLKLEGVKEVPERVTLGAWPNEALRVLDRKALGPSTLWEVPLLSMKSLEPNDSAIVMYWKVEPLRAGEKREVGFEYGLWNLASEGSRLATTIDGAFRPGGALTVVAYVNAGGIGPEDETLTLSLPEGFKLLDGQATQPVPRAAGNKNRPVTWRVQAGSTGKYELTVKSSAGVSQTIPVEIRKGIFD